MAVKPIIKQYRLGELFCGPGGIALGAIKANIGIDGASIVHQWANDIDSDTCQTYAHNICGDRNSQSVICENVRNIHMSQLTDIDGLAFGFPCNDFSLAGERKGFDGVYGPLYTYGIQALEYFKPMWFMAENVSGLSSANQGEAFKKILEDMKNAGYTIVPHLYKFEEYGIPQARHRIIIVGIRNDLTSMGYRFKVPDPAPYKDIDNTCRTAIESPPIAPGTFNHEFSKQSPIVTERLSYIKPGENAFTADLPEHLRLNVRGVTMSQIYKRLNPALPSYTVMGSGGGGTSMYHWTEPRALTNRERARLQTFPDDFEFIGGMGSVRKQIGMAVPVKGAQIIFEAILKTFAGIEYPALQG